MGITLNIDAESIDGEPCYTVRQFAMVTGLSEGVVYHLIKAGNKHRKLKCSIKEKKKYVPSKELYEFPFTAQGGNYGTYYFTKDGFIDFSRSEL